MLTTVAYSCARNGSRVFVPFARLSLLSSVKSSTRAGQRDLSGHRSSRLLSPPPWYVQGRLSARPVCLSADPHSPLPAAADSNSQEREVFGTLSSDMASKISFRKSTSLTEDFRYREWDEEDAETPRRKPARRNTQYWYFLQCKKLIKQNKVSGPDVPGRVSTKNLHLLISLLLPQQLQEALDVFNRDMLQAERLQPKEFNYTILIGGCARAGQLKQAFRLYNDV